MARRYFFSTFQIILAGAGVSTLGCGPTGQCSRITFSESSRVDFDALSSALSDGVIDSGECASLCGVDDWARVDACRVGFPEATTTASPSDGGTSDLDSGGGAGGEGGQSAKPEVAIQCEGRGLPAFCEGRRHATWGARHPAQGASVIGRWLAQAAADEAGSVRSFRALARELQHFQLSAQLIGRLRLAARQEIGHARMLERLAQVHGARRPAQPYQRLRERTLLAIGIENAVEGCVAETYAGLVASYQAATAVDPAIRRAFIKIAAEEAQHADLAWSLHEELRTRLDADARAQLDAALEDAVRALEVFGMDLTHGHFASSVEAEHAQRVLGLPDPATDAAMRAGLVAELRGRTLRAA